MKIWHALKQSFVVGLVAILPIYITIRVVVGVFNYVDQATSRYLQNLLFGFRIPGLGLVSTVIVITVAGFLTRFVLFRRTGRTFEAFIGSIPFVRTVYAVVKQVLLPLVGDETTRAFKQVVALEWPGNDVWAMGFVVKEEIVGDEPGPRDRMLVFVPTNHLHLGFVISTHRERLRPVQVSIEDALRTQFSLGVAAPDLQMLGSDPGQPRNIAEILRSADNAAAGTPAAGEAGVESGSAQTPAAVDQIEGPGGPRVG
jgi:uncharacterized membrane protein